MDGPVVLTPRLYGDCFSSQSVASVGSLHHCQHQPRWTQTGSSTAPRCHVTTASPDAAGFVGDGRFRWDHPPFESDDDDGGHVTVSQVTGSEITGDQVEGSEDGGCQATRNTLTGCQVTESHVTESHVTGSKVAGSQVTGSQVTESHVTGNKVTASHVIGSLAPFVDGYGYDDATGRYVNDDRQRSTRRWPPIGIHGNCEELDNELPLYPWMNVIGQ